MSKLVPIDWLSSTVGDYCYVTKLAGYEYTNHFDYSIGGDVIAVRALNLKKGKLDLNQIQTIPRAVSDALPRSKLSTNDLVISYVGTIGEIAFIDEDDKYHLAPNVAKITPDSEKINGKFLAHVLTSDETQKSIQLLGSVTSQPSLSMGNLRKVFIPVPPLPEQQKIAAILTSVDDVIEKTQAQINKLKDLKTGMMQELLTRGVSVDGKPHTEFKDSPVGRIPKAWDVVQISELCTDVVDCVNKTAPVVDYKTPYKMLRTTNIKNGRVDTDNVRCVTKETYHTWTRRMKPESGDLIFTREAPVGECGVLKDAKGVFLGQRTMMYRANKTKTSSGYLMYSLMSEYGQKQLENFSGGSTVPHMRVPDCSKILIKLPSLKEQRIIADSLNSLDFSRQKKEQKVSKLSSLKKALMQDLLTGKVRVNVD
jgi:type I restriction enzyme S subunit